MKFKRIFLIILDSFGIGAMDDAKQYNDENTNTYLHILEKVPTLSIPHLRSLGLDTLARNDPSDHTMGAAIRLKEKSNGKDTITGHWEMMGLQIDEPFQTFTDTGFPADLIQELEAKTGHHYIGNKAASGTEILKELGECERQSQGEDLILYTSADSVLQICGDEEGIGLDELYRCCQIAREICMKPEWKVARVIARPYVYRNGSYIRTSHRKDYALAPFQKTALDRLKEHGYDVLSIGKISDIFHAQGITAAFHSDSSIHGMEQTIEQLDHDFSGLCFTNLVDFDAKYGHRRDPVGYGKELEAFDRALARFLDSMQEEDLLIISADHGNDPTHSGTDHTRECVPCLVYAKGMGPKRLDDRMSFAAIGATILENFDLQNEKIQEYSIFEDLF